MKIFLARVLSLMLAETLFLILAGSQGWAEAQPGAETIPAEIQELEKSIHLLETPQEPQKLAAQLRNLLESKKRLLEEEKLKKEEQIEERSEFITQMDKWSKIYEEQILLGLRKIISGIRSFPVRARQFKEYLRKEENYQEILSVSIRFLIALAAGFGVWILLRNLTRRRGKKWSQKEPADMAERMSRAALNTFLGIYPWIGVWIIFFLFSRFFPTDEVLEAILFRGILAIIFFRALKRILYFFFSPEIGSRRVFPLPDEISGYVYIWARRVLVFSFWVYVFYLPCSFLQFLLLKTALSIFYKIGVGIFGAVILAQLRESLRGHLHLPLRENDPPWKSSGKRALNFVSGNLYLLGIIYIAFGVVLSFSGVSKAYSFFLNSSWKSFLVLFAAVVFWYLWKYLFRRLIEIGRTIREEYPGLEKRVNQYLDYVHLTGYFAIVLFAAVTLLDVWGARVYAFLAANMIWVKSLLRIPATLLFAFLLIQASAFLIDKFARRAKTRMAASSNVPPGEVEKRVSTLANIFHKAFTVVALSFAAITILSELGFDIKPLLAGAGIVGLAVGFGGQNLVRDVISGLFFTFENRIRVGDVAILNGTGGLVEQVNLRTTVLRGQDGTVHVFPNGSINTLANMTYEFSYYSFEVGVAYKEDTDRVTAVLKEIGEKIMQEEEYRSAILAPLEILGVDKFGDSAVTIRARIKTLPIKQWLVGREMNRRIKKRFDELGIEIPFPHQSLYFGEASKPIRVKLEAAPEDRERIKSIVREVLKEPAGGKGAEVPPSEGKSQCDHNPP